MKPVINRRKCPVQKDLCKAIQACATGAIYYVEDEDEPLGGRIEINDALCNACGLCVSACCGRAIEMAAGGVDSRDRVDAPNGY
jgi:formate hydrogenlyase subunit 6/NADH:ubiquinone oxidoreductase subunit I